MPATLRTLFSLPESLTARDEAANTFEKNLTRSTPRNDTPLTIPVPGEPEEALRHRALLRANAAEKSRLGEAAEAEISQEPLTTFQQALVGLADHLNNKAHGRARTAEIRTEHEAAVHVAASLSRFLER